MDYTCAEIAKMIDHSLLFPTMTDEELEEGLQICLKYNVGSACIMPHYLRRTAEVLADSDVAASTTIGFPHGCPTTTTKEFEATEAVRNGCQELDMVCNVAKVLSEDWDYVRADIKAVIDVAHGAGQKVKVIFENPYLEDRHKIKLCEICTDLKADWVKHTTGYTVGKDPAATDHDLQLLIDNTPDEVQVKSSGQERTLEEMVHLKQMGVTRVGITKTVEVLEECRRRYES